MKSEARLRLAIISSADLLRRPWGAAHHFPGQVTPAAQRLVLAHQALTNLRAGTAIPTDEECALLLDMVEEWAKYHLKRPRMSLADRANRTADTEHLINHGVIAAY
jgi:hypothetical protein